MAPREQPQARGLLRRRASSASLKQSRICRACRDGEVPEIEWQPKDQRL